MSERENQTSLEVMVGRAEAICSIGSPSTTSHLTLDVFGTAVQKNLVGSMSIFKFMQNGQIHYGLGQITEVLLRNSLAEEHIMRGLTRQRGEIPRITGEQDTHTADMLTSAVFVGSQAGVSPSSLGTVPSTGTKIRLLDQGIMDRLFESFRDSVSFVGKIMATDVLFPSWFKHFGNGDGGLGDTRHIGIFGKTGSGKSYLAKMILTSYMRHRSMTLLVLDPQGQFSQMKDDASIMKHVKDRFNRQIEFYNLANMTFPSEGGSWRSSQREFELFGNFLKASRFFESISVVAEDNQDRTLDVIRSIMRRNRINLGNLSSRQNFDTILREMCEESNLSRIYSGASGQTRVQNRIGTADPEFFGIWERVANLFGRTGTESVTDILNRVGETEPGRIIVIDLSDTNIPDNVLWNDNIKKRAINEILSNLIEIAQTRYSEKGLLNALVVLDEAHRYAPRERTDDPAVSLLKNTLKDAVRETRKFGLGWMLINQSISGLDRELINQMGMYFFGYGLAYGAERQALMDLIGGHESAARLYSQFKDPASTLPPHTYSFMSVGPSSPMSFSQAPLFFNALQYPDEYVHMNAPKQD